MDPSVLLREDWEPLLASLAEVAREGFDVCSTKRGRRGGRSARYYNRMIGDAACMIKYASINYNRLGPAQEMCAGRQVLRCRSLRPAPRGSESAIRNPRPLFSPLGRQLALAPLARPTGRRYAPPPADERDLNFMNLS